MTEPCDYREGDWVSFQQDGLLRVGQVVAVLEQLRYPYGFTVITTAGSTGDNLVLEVRRRETAAHD